MVLFRIDNNVHWCLGRLCRNGSASGDMFFAFDLFLLIGPGNLSLDTSAPAAIDSPTKQVVWGSACLFVGPFTLGALRCFIVAACAHVCRGAISVGVLLVCLQSQIVSSQSVDRPF